LLEGRKEGTPSGKRAILERLDNPSAYQCTAVFPKAGNGQREHFSRRICPAA